MAHTPGPWEAWNAVGGTTLRRWNIGERNTTPGVVRQIAIIANETADRSGDEQVANARLIAAAPELLAALERVIVYAENELESIASLNDSPETQEELDACQDAIDAAYNAISKAKGEV